MPQARDRGALRHTRIISLQATHQHVRCCSRRARGRNLAAGEGRVARGCNFTIRPRRRTTGVAGDSQAAARRRRRHHGVSISPGRRHPHRAARCGSSITPTPNRALFRLNTINRWVGEITAAQNDGAGDAVFEFRLACGVPEGSAVLTTKI